MTAGLFDFLAAELFGTRCLCGSAKESRQTFCRRCYFRLPKELRIALYRRLGHGYEDAYQRAAKFLDSLSPAGVNHG